MKALKRKEVEKMPFDKIFEVGMNQEFCHSTGYRVYDGERWWNEYEDSEGNLHYGN